MRTYIGYLLSATAALGLMAHSMQPVSADPPKSKSRSTARRSGAVLVSTEPRIEKSLLGVRILQSYKSVLALYGAPTRVYKSGESILFNYANNAEGKPTGGVIGLSDAATTQAGGAPGGAGAMARPGGGAPGMMGAMPPGMGGGGSSSMMGMMQGAMQRTAANRPGGMGGSSSMPPMMSGMRPGGGSPMMGAMPPGMGGGGSSSMMGMMSGMRPGGGAPPGMMGAMPGMGGGAAAGGAAGQEEDTFETAGGYIWVYMYPAKEMAYLFAFNRDGRLEAAAQYGRVGGGATSKGVRLGDSISRVYQGYGWPDGAAQANVGTHLFYNAKSHVQFEVLDNKVIMIAVVLRETTKVRSAGQSAGGGAMAGAPGAAGMMGGGRAAAARGGGKGTDE